MRWMRNTYKILVIITHGKRQLEDLDTDGRLTLKYIFKKGCEGVHWIQLTWDWSDGGLL